MSRITLIAAVARNGVIGDHGRIPWRLPADFAHFKATTMGHTLVMGRATFDSIGRALPGRRTIVVTRNPSWSRPGIDIAHSLEQAYAMAANDGEIFVAGGGAIYAEAIAGCQRLIISRVDQEAEGDVSFPEIDSAQWQVVSAQPHLGFTVETLEPRTRA